MIDFLLGVPSAVKTLLDRLTATRAANLDNLNATISSRAAASTAVSNADYTTARAAKLDASIQSSALNSNIQTGYFNLGNANGTGTNPDETWFLDVTVSSVPGKVLIIVQTSERNGANADVIGRMTSTTNLRLSGVNNFMRGRWYLVEFK